MLATRDVGLGGVAIGLFDEGIDRHRGTAVGRRLDVAVARLGARGHDAESHQATVPGCLDAAADRRPEGLHVTDHVVGGHHQQQRVFVVLCRHAGCKCHRGRRVAADGLEQDARRHADGRHLLGDQEPVRLVADHEALGRRARHAVHAGRRLLQHGRLADQRQKLLGVHRARRGPEARPRAATQNHGPDDSHAFLATGTTFSLTRTLSVLRLPYWGATSATLSPRPIA